MYSSYEDIKTTLEEVDCPENYIIQGLNELGYESFPESGLNDKGKSKLLNIVLDIQKSETSLSLRRYKTKVKKENGKIIIEKTPINKPQKKCKSLEMEILKEDLQKIGKGIKEYTPEVIRGIAKFITYPTIGVNFLFPTMIRKAEDVNCYTENGYNIPKGVTIAGGIIESVAGYIALATTGNSKYILPVALTQIGTNIASGLYEYWRNIKERARKRN